MAGHLKEVLNDFEAKARPTIPARSVGIDVAKESAEARDLWHRGSKAATAEFAEKKGMAAAKNEPRKLELNFQAELDKINNPKKFSPFQGNPEQATLIRKIAEGEPGRTATADTIAKWSNNLLGFGTIGSAGGLAALSQFNDPYGISGTASTVGPTVMAAALLGKGGAGALRKGIADRGAARVDDLIRHIVTGSAEKPAVQNMPREALAKVLAADQIKRAAGRYSSNWYDKE
jgi:hypothetical protein